MMSESHPDLDRRRHRRPLHLNRATQMNSFDADTARAIRDAVERFAADDAVRVMVLAGEGKVFSAGGDFNWVLSWPELDAITRHAGADAMMGAVQAIYDFPKPSIARVHGSAVGGGVGLMLACDFAVAVVVGALRPDLGAQRPAGRHRHPGADRGGGPARGAPAPDAWRHVRCGDRAAHRPGRPGGRGRCARRHRRDARRRAEARRALGPDADQEAGHPRSTRCRTMLRRPPTSWASTSPTSASPRRRSKACGAFLDKRKPKWAV